MRSLHVLPVLAALGVASPALAQSPDLIALQTGVGFATSTPGGPGGFNEGFCTVFNVTDGTVRVKVSAQVTYADGTVSVLSDLTQPIALEPGDGFEQSILFLVPEGTALGTATFQCDARATGRGREQEVGTATFEVVAP